MPAGAILALALIEFPTLGIAALLLVAGMFSFRPKTRRTTFGLLSGAGLPFLFVAFVNRQGPGTTCWRTLTSAGCDQHLNPVPWLLIGIVLLAVGALAQARRA